MTGRDSSYHGAVALSAVLAAGGSMQALKYLRERLVPEHFGDHEQQALFGLLCNYADQARGILPKATLQDVLRSYPPGTAVAYEVLYDTLAAAPPEEHAFYHSVDQLRELHAIGETSGALSLGRAVLTGEVRQGDGPNAKILRGHEDARAAVMAALARIDRDYGLTATPEGDVTVEGDDVLAAYARIKDLRRQGRHPGVLFGLPDLDTVLGDGILPGELALVASWMSGGKSSFCAQAAWHASVMQGLNVVIFTTEALRDAVRLKLAARHSAHLAAGLGFKRGLDDSDIRAGRLDEEGEGFLAATMADWKTGGYGKCNVVQVPDNGTMSMISGRFETISRQYHVDLCVIDYLQLLVPERVSRDSNMHQDQSGIVQAAARFAPTCNRGRGVPVLSPWQINRAGQEKLASAGGYALEHLSSTLAGGQAANIVLFLASPEEDHSGGRMAPVEVTVGKNRSGRKGNRFPLTADFASSVFEPRGSGNAEELLDPFGGALG